MQRFVETNMKIDGTKLRARARWAGLVALGTLVAGCGGDAEAGDAEPAAEAADGYTRIVNVEVRPVAPTSFVEEIPMTGAVEANRDVVVSAEETGPIRRLPVEKGSRVAQGQAIAAIDDAVLAAQVEQARAQATLAQETWQRRKRLFEQDRVGSELAYLEARYAAEQAQASLTALEERLSKTIIRAPISGILDSRDVEIGSMVTVGTPIARIIQVDTVKIKAGVPERYALAVRTGSSVRVTFDVLGGREYEAEISYVGAAVNPQNRTFPVEFRLPNDDETIKPEMVAKVSIVSAVVDDAIVVPQEALVRVEEGYVVYVVESQDGQEIARVREIERGTAQRNRVIIRSGLEAGDRLIVVGQQQVTDGDQIRVVASHTP
jgi:membrane fusion protein (multidrug efflux system)